MSPPDVLEYLWPALAHALILSRRQHAPQGSWPGRSTAGARCGPGASVSSAIGSTASSDCVQYGASTRWAVTCRRSRSAGPIRPVVRFSPNRALYS
jgi:hypothetical protein